MAQFTAEKFLDFIVNYREGNPKQKAAMLEFAQKVLEKQPELLTDDANWVRVYRTPVENSTALKVPYFSQRDNYKDAARTCFSSSCAMLLEFMKPGTLPGPTGDDKYLRKVFSIGDTVSPNVQIQALASFGLEARFITNCTFALLDSQLEKKKPVPIGILHKGPASAPSGGGHWIIVIGKEKDSKAPGGCWYIVHDPYGELSNSSGTYSSTDGENLKYSKSMLSARWAVEGDGSGWAILA